MSNELTEKIEKAFDYRGDVTLDLVNGSTVSGFLYNRDTKTAEPFVELYLENETSGKKFLLRDIRDVRLTGEDMAAGKSWEEWQAKREREKAKGIERAAKKADPADQHRDLKVF